MLPERLVNLGLDIGKGHLAHEAAEAGAVEPDEDLVVSDIDKLDIASVLLESRTHLVKDLLDLVPIRRVAVLYVMIGKGDLAVLGLGLLEAVAAYEVLDIPALIAALPELVEDLLDLLAAAAAGALVLAGAAAAAVV